MVEIYQQAGFHQLPQTQKSPFHRGPHRLTKITEAANKQVQMLQKQAVPTIQPQKILQRRNTPTIVYDNNHFPSLPVAQRASSTSTNATSKSSTTPNIPSRQSSTLTNRLDSLETRVQNQKDQLVAIQHQLQEQQDSLQRLTKIVEDQQQLMTTLQETVRQLTTSMSNTEKIMTQLLQFHRKDPPTPDSQQPVKRSRLRTASTSPGQANDALQDTDMSEQDNWEASPNMPSPTNHEPSLSR